MVGCACFHAAARHEVARASGTKNVRNGRRSSAPPVFPVQIFACIRCASERSSRATGKKNVAPCVRADGAAARAHAEFRSLDRISAVPVFCLERSEQTPDSHGVALRAREP